MRKLNFEWILFTAAGAILGTIAVEIYKKQKMRSIAEKLRNQKPAELLIIDKL